VNPNFQHWQIPNLFILGASAFLNTGSANPTPTVLALTYRTADAFVDRHLKKPAPLAYGNPDEYSTHRRYELFWLGTV
jgi:gluconate 2-dehydrogenase alpha chain